MKKFVVMLLVLLSFTACSEEQPDLKQWLRDGVVIDTRTLEEYNSGHIDNATLIPYDVIQQQISRVVPDKSTPVLLYCRSGRRAGIAETTLKKLGYENVINVGGINDMQSFIQKNR